MRQGRMIDVEWDGMIFILGNHLKAKNNYNWQWYRLSIYVDHDHSRYSISYYLAELSIFSIAFFAAPTANLFWGLWLFSPWGNPSTYSGEFLMLMGMLMRDLLSFFWPWLNSYASPSFCPNLWEAWSLRYFMMLLFSSIFELRLLKRSICCS